MATKNLLEFYGIDADDIPSGQEMATAYLSVIPPSNEGLICYDKNSSKPCGMATTEKGIKWFGELEEGFSIYQGQLDDDFLPHGRGILSNGNMFFRANFIHGEINDSNAIFFMKNDEIKKACFLRGIRLY